MDAETFFSESREQSRIKAKIVAKYFWAWAKIISSTLKRQDRRIAYMDLFSGPGRYADGTPSTPAMVLEKIIKDSDLRERLVTLFNDKDANNVRSLRDTIENIPGIESLRYKPFVRNEEVGQKIMDAFEQMKSVPTFLFVDPWEYKGLSLALINSVLQTWGSDCVFFFNYNRINPGLNNEVVREHMNDLFGERRATSIREKRGLDPESRENLIISELSDALREVGGTYVHHFAFRNDQGTRTVLAQPEMER